MIVVRRSLVARSLGRSLARSLARSIDHSLARSLARSIARSLTDMCSLQSQYKGAAFGRHHKGGRAAFGRAATFVVSFVLALNRAHVLAVSTTHVLRLSKVEVLALNKAHVLRLNNDCRSSLACRSLARSLARSVARSIACWLDLERGGEQGRRRERVPPRERQCFFRRDNIYSGETMCPPEKQ